MVYKRLQSTRCTRKKILRGGFAMVRGRTRRPPSVRNLELYHDFVCEHKTQAFLAAELEISQPRVAAVCRKVKRWVETLVSRAPATL